ncbi:MAG: HD domain-containing protein [Candidatus Omnitrophica bacterium]|nr:HD domain-containing protein [Candidatus Omnitrophota bacterium]
MSLDYKKELEDAAKTMILVHEPESLIRMIVRTIVQKVRIKHAGILLRDKARDTYVLTVSRGAQGLKIPKGYARMDADNPLISLFRDPPQQHAFDRRVIIFDKIKKILKSKTASAALKKSLKGALYQMEIFEATACIPAYFRNELLGLLLLGRKKSGHNFRREVLDFFVALASDVAMAIRNAQLFTDLQEELEKNKRLFLHTTVALAAAIDAKDHYTHGHTARVTNLSLAIAERLKERNIVSFDQEFLEQLHIAGLLHDIGKIGIPESILNKDASLNEAEKKRMEEHPLVGETILSPIKELGESVLGVKYHHEKYDGSGYPEGLKGEQIPLIAAIISVADTFDAMITDRPYRKGLSKEEAIAEIERVSGSQFDSRIARALIELYREKKV